MSCEIKEFGKLPGGEPVFAHTLSNCNGIRMTVLDLGGIIQSLTVPGRDGTPADIVCGFDTVEDYLADDQYFGSLVGRYANRISEGAFKLGGKEYKLALNEGGKEHLHGGKVGYNRRLWKTEHIKEGGCDALRLSLFSPDGEEGYPSDVKITVTYTLTDGDEVRIKYFAECGGETVVNLTNHSYFNMAGYSSGPISGHTVRINADRYTEVDSLLIPTGKSPDVTGTRFDLREPTLFTEDFDHNFILNGYDGSLRFAASFGDPVSGRTMEVYTTLPGIQIYSAVNMCGGVAFKGGVPQKRHSACCFETQFFPDTPNNPSFPSCVFGPERPYCSETRFRFFVK